MDPLGILIGSVEYSTVPKVFKICQMTFNLHFDEKIIIIRSVVLKIYAFKICEKNALLSVTDTIYRDPSQHEKIIYHQNNVRNVFSNIELPLGYNIITLEHVLERMWRKSKKHDTFVQNPVKGAHLTFKCV